MKSTWNILILAIAILIASVSSGSAVAVIGNTNNGTLTEPIWSGGAWINASRFQATSNMTVVTMHAKVSAITGKYKCAIYTGSSSQPSRLLRTTTEVTNPTTDWQTFPLTAPQSLTNGAYYWLAIWSDSASAQAYYSDNSGALLWGQYDYGAWPDPLVTTDGSTARFCIYAQAAVPTLVSIAITPANPTIVAGNTRQFTATGTYSDSSTQNLTSQVTWNSSSTTTATINTNGLATGVAAGTTTISATLGGVSGNTLLTVQPAPPTIAVIGNTNNGTLTEPLWSSGAWVNACRFQAASNMTVVTMHAKVSAITGKYKCAIYTGSSSQPSRLLRTTTEVTNPTTDWQTFPLTAPQSLTNGAYYWLAIWSDNASAQAYYSDNSGALLWGQYDYGAWPDPLVTTDGSTARFCIYAQAAMATLVSIAVTPANPTIMAGSTQQFTAMGTYSDSSTQNLTSQVTWNSSSTTRATINANGLATGVAAGTTTISATLSGVSGNTLLTVQPAPPTVAITSPANNSTVGTNFTINATATDSDGTVTNVSFYDGLTLLGSDTSTPYSYAWSGAPLGAHGLKAVARDNGGLATTSAVVNITVTALNVVTTTETFDSYTDGMVITNIGGGGVWTSGTNTVLGTGGVNGSRGLSLGSRVFNWKAQTFQWSALAVGTKLAMSLDFQTSATGRFDDDRVGWTITPDASTSTGSQLALQLDNTTEGGMVFYHNLTRTPVLNALSGIQSNTWYRFNVEFTKLTATSAGVVGTLTELNASGNPTGTPYVGTIADTSTFANPPTNALFTAAQQCPSFKNHDAAAGNADNATFTITPAGPQPPTVAITSPANNATVNTNFTINATATDDGTIANVDFYDGSTLLGSDNTGPAYSYAWNSAPLGSHALKAVAWDNDGLASTSAVVNVTVATLEPVVVTETFDSYANGLVITNIGGGGVWTSGGNTVLSTGGVNGSGGLSTSSAIFNWKAQTFQWSTLAVGTKVAMALDFQSSTTGRFDDDRVGWTITPDASTSTGSQLALQLDNTTEGGMVFYHNSTRTPVLNALIGIKNSTWYRFNVEFTKLTATSATIVGILTELDGSGNPTGTPYVGTIADTSTFANPPGAALFTATQQCPSFKNYSNADGNADNATFTITPVGPQPPTVSITSPANNATVGVGFTIIATATDDGTIASVDFYDGSTLLGSDAASPYTYAWNSAPLGSHALKAVAWDNDGLASTSAVVNVTVAAAAAGFTAYNDCSKGDGVNPANTTEYPGNGTYSGLLKDFNTGAALPVTLTLITNLITYDGTGGPMPNAGTDAYNTFSNKVVFDNVIWYTAASNGFWMDAVFTGLDPAKEYEFATSVNRGGSGSDYGSRFSKFTISDLDSADNASTPGVTVNSATSVSFCSGINTVNGYVARWTKIKCGADGDFKVRVEDGGGVGKGYAFDGIMLRETGTSGPQAPTVAITSPANNATLSTNFTITATATDSDSTVTNVYFYNGSTLLGSDSSSPYTYAWSAAPLGAHALRAVAWDNTGLAGTSAVVNVTVTAPSVVTATEAFDSYANGLVITNIGGGGVWTSGTNTVLSTGGVNGSGGISFGTRVFNWKAQTFQWSALADGTKVGISLDFQSSATGKFDDDRVGWTITPDTTGSTGSQLALQLDNTTEGGMVFYHNATRTPVLDDLSGIKSNAWYRFNVEFTKLGATNASIVGTLTELDASGNPTGTPFVGTIADTSTFANPPTNTLFTATQQCPSFKNHNAAAGNADNATFTITPPDSQPPAAAQYVIVISVDGMGSAYVTPLLTPGLLNELTTFKRFQAEGSGTLNARTDFDYAITLPNHLCMMTCRGVGGASGHNWTGNGDPSPTDTLALNKGSYVASGFDVSHDHGLRTGIWAGKSKFSLFQQSYSATSGAPDITGADNGQDKIDYDKVGNLSAATLTDDLTSQMAASPFNFVFFHFHEPDTAGHSSGWSTNPTSAYAASLKAVDTQIGRIIQMVENSPTLQGKTAIIVTADHGGHGTTHGDMSNPLDYTVPFYVWGASATAGGDLYALNPTSRTSPGTSNPPYTGGQPVRNGDAANLALNLLGLGAIPGSTIGSAQDLVVTGTAITVTVTATSGQSKVFGAADPTLTYVSSDPGVTFTGALGRASGEDVGSYAINQGNLSAEGNYVITFVPADFAISAKPITVTVNSGQSKVFGASDPVLTYVCSDLGASCTGALGRASGESVGNYAINQGGLSAGANYALTFVPADFAIMAKPITVTANSGLSKMFGASDPVLTYVCSDLGASCTGSLGRAAGENVGSYAINQGGLSAGANYAITFVPADFAITPASSTTTISSSLNPSTAGSNVTFTVTVSPVAPATATLTGNVQFLTNDVAVGSPVSLTDGTATLDTALLPPGTNTVTASYLGDDNYAGSTDNLLQVVTVVVETPSVLGIAPNGDGSVTVTFAGTPGAEYLVLATTDLVSPGSWVNVSTNTAGPNGQWTYTDNAMTSQTQRFFRAAKP